MTTTPRPNPKASVEEHRSPKRPRRQLRGLLLALASVNPVLAQTTPAEPSTGPQITWEVKHRFPLFKSETALSDVLKLNPDKPLVEWATETLAQSPDLLAPLTAEYRYSSNGGCLTPANNQTFKTLWNPCTEKYDSKLFELPESHDIYVQINQAPAGLCTFRLGPTPPFTAACNSRVVLTVPRSSEGQSLVVENDAGAPPLRATIRVKDILLFAFGDSFASGESNPDTPAIHENYPTHVGEAGLALSGVTWLNGDHKLARRPRWQDTRCHRSVLSWPILAAAKLAAENPHMVVRIASWACTGAEITDGFFSAQLRGANDAMGIPVKRSQFFSARESVCAKTKPQGSGPSIKTVVRNGKSGSAGKAMGCLKEDRLREIDGILFTFGGNDVYFGPVILDSVGITGTHIPFVDWKIKPLRKKLVKTPQQAKARIKGRVSNTYDRLHTRYEALDNGFASLGVTPDRVYQIQYPNPLMDSNGKYCAKSDFDGMDTLDKVQDTSNLTEWESQNAYENMILPLTGAIKPSLYKWNVVDGHTTLIAKHGLCAYYTNKQLELAVPRLSFGNWERNFKPSDYNHYATTARWFRTPDDVVMGMFSGSSFLPVDGAFHPSAAAHAAIADQVALQLKERFAKP